MPAPPWRICACLSGGFFTAPGFRDSRSLAPEAVLRTTAVTEPPCRAGRESSRLLSPHRGSCPTTLVSSSERTHLLRSKGGSRAIFPLIPCGALSWHSRSRSHLASNKPKSFSHGDTETQCLRGSVVRSSGFSLLGHGAAWRLNSERLSVASRFVKVEVCDSDSDLAVATCPVSPRRHGGHGDSTEASGFSVHLRVLRVSVVNKVLEFFSILASRNSPGS